MTVQGMTERAAPFYCPYCGDEDLRPFGEQHGEWRCGACQRVFRLELRRRGGRIGPSGARGGDRSE